MEMATERPGDTNTLALEDSPDPSPEGLTMDIMDKLRINSLRSINGDGKVDYENYASLLEVTASILLPSGPTRRLRVLIDCGATSNFIHKETIEEIGVSFDSSKEEKIATGDGEHEITTVGETSALTMRIGNIYKHRSKYFVMNLGDYDAVLGMPWIQHSRCVISGKETTLGGTHITVEYKKNHPRIQLPLLLKGDTEDLPRIYSMSNKDMIKELPHSQERYTLLYKGFKKSADKHPAVPLDDPLKGISRPQGVPELEKILEKHRAVFPEDLPKQLPMDREISLQIPIKPGTVPPCQAPYRTNEEGQKVIEETLNYLYQHGLARDSYSEYGAPVTLVKKQDGTWRFCVDYRKLNAITKEAKYPLPRIDDCLDRLGKAKYFSKLDLRSGYWQVKVHPKDVEKTAFRTAYGHHEFLVVPFGLQGAPSTFQRLMNLYLRPFLGKSVLVYLDDILIYSETQEDHLKHISQVLEVLEEKKMFAKASKCDLFKTQMSFLGYTVGEGCISTDPEKIKAIKDWKEPSTVREVRSFLGMANFYRKFIEKFSHKAKPLTDILKSTEFKEKYGRQFTKTAPVQFGDKEKKAFEELKEALITAPLLVIFDHSKRTELWVDASTENGCVGAVLMQDHGKGLQPVAYLSTVLSSAEQKYATWEQELLALKVALEQWRHYLLPLRFTARTDNNGVRYLKTQKHLKDRQWRWLGFFSEYQFDLYHRAGAKMQVPDALSRKPHDLDKVLRYHEEDDHQVAIQVKGEKVFLTLKAPSPPEIPQLGTLLHLDYSQDKELSSIFEALEKDPTLGEKHPKYRTFQVQGPHLIWKDGKGLDRVVIPCNLRLELVKEYHDTPLGGHFGAGKVYQSLRRYFYWPGMKDFVERYITTCDACQKNKSWNQKPLGIPQAMDIPDFPWQVVSVDFCGPFPTTKNGYDFVMVTTDHLTKMAIIIPTTTKVSAKDAAQLMVEFVVKRFGVPIKITSDRGPQFMAQFWKNLWKRLGTRVALTAPYHPQANAQVERYNRTMEESLRSFVGGLQDDWDQHLILLEFAYNDTVNPSTGYTPFFLNHGRHPTTPMIIGKKSNLPSVEEYILEIDNVLKDARDKVVKAQADYMELQKKLLQEPNLKEGDMVLLKAENYNLRLPSRKLSPRWLGPFRILKFVTPTTVKLELPLRFKDLDPVQNLGWLKPYKQRGQDLGPAVIQQEPEIIDGEEEFEVETILADRYKGTRKQYLVRFKSYGPEADEWLPQRNLENAQEKVKEYWDRQKGHLFRTNH